MSRNKNVALRKLKGDRQLIACRQPNPLIINCQVTTIIQTWEKGDRFNFWQCFSGKVLTVKPCLDMAADLLSGRVVSDMPGFQPRTTKPWLSCPSRQLVTAAARLPGDTFKKQSKAILQQLIEKGILDDSVLR